MAVAEVTVVVNVVEGVVGNVLWALFHFSSTRNVALSHKLETNPTHTPTT